ncbi:MAG: SMP-30/gluconolactonase/LRE family protein [Deltaproteobacteria bacterium]|nr:SMP-30/gluconolactonase/LRE family protein [Deltaproteobacteria bacterium]
MISRPLGLCAVFSVAALVACGPATSPDDGSTVTDSAIDAVNAIDAREDASVSQDATMDTATSPDAGLDASEEASVSVPDASDAPDVPDANVDAGPPVNPMMGIGAVELVRAGFMFTEGPQWRSREGDLLFSDIPANTIHRVNTPAMFTVFRMPSDNSNGLAVDAMGRLLAAEHGSRSVTRTRADGSRETLAREFREGGMMRRLNSPNDVIVRSDGTVYFTDPPFGIPAGQTRELTFNGVFRLSPTGVLTAEYRGGTSTRPNGIALSPDERTLYVADSADGNVRAWAVGTDGALTGERIAARTMGNADGMAVDSQGNLFVTTRVGVEVFAPSGTRWGTITVPMQPANCAFGESDRRTLFITARQGLFRVRLAMPGLY